MERSAELLGRGSTVSTVSLLEHLTSGWVGGSKELRELSVAQSCIAIRVNSADDGEELTLSGVVAAAAEEGAQIEGVDTSIVVLVDRSVGSVGREIVADFEITLEDVQSSLEVDFLLEDVKEGQLDVAGEAVVAANVP